MKRPIGYFVHHQGRGHAERAAALAAALPADRPLTMFCARDDIFPPLPAHVRIVRIPSLFEPPADADARWSEAMTPPTLHCAPIGWPTITQAIATLAAWFAEARPALFVTDVSAELAQFARIASVPCVTVLQHGSRDDAGHMAAYAGAVGVLAPYHRDLEQPGRPDWMLAKTHHAAGLGVAATEIARETARAALDLPAERPIVLVIAGGGGGGTPATPVTLGARADPDTLWITIGSVVHEWHATPPANLRHMGWVGDPERWIAAADRIVSSAGNTTVHMVAAAAKPWVVVPEWRYFDEQIWKARMLDAAGAAIALEHWPSHAGAWDAAWTRAASLDVGAQQRLVQPQAARDAAAWIEALAGGGSDAVADATVALIAEPVV
ncbi:glycosyltransferase family protein [Sphingomonas baiyangensis]|uniref:Glycosyl transferase family 28 C-terminal domain-containing protein n=1 Tax=Sphingomonas baiyangensis TaxID=2572576 RepID=A0A4U1L4J3_9SPHN|nr:hypothetical protein [Sphingomonas baiyangensis]TKD51133.1 hypothetical protein FBR43_10460 [Sphingomonas baiyangensis]